MTIRVKLHLKGGLSFRQSVRLFVHLSLSVVSVGASVLCGERTAMLRINLRGIKFRINQQVHEIWSVNYQEIR